MSSAYSLRQVITVGFAMFSMFFGAGNIIFPLIVGRFAEGEVVSAIFGLIITAIGIPLLGLFGMTLFDGNFREFFNRIGKVPGRLVIAIILGLIGPFGGIPRCIAFSYSTSQVFFEQFTVVPFCFVACAVIYLFSMKKSRIVDVVGAILTPILLVSLGVIIVKGLMNPLPSSKVIHTANTFFMGLTTGYQTMDLLASFFFCSVVIQSLKSISKVKGTISQKVLIQNTCLASGICALLLAATYGGLCYVAAVYAPELAHVEKDRLLTEIALLALGSKAGLVTSIAVILACLTTAIALTSVFAEYIREDLFKNKISYRSSLMFTLVISFMISILEFSGIAAFLGPIVSFLYPGLVVLLVCNIWYKTAAFSKESATI